MKWHPFSNNRGVALIIVILMISIIIAVTLELNRTTRASVYESANLADRIKLHYTAKSGFNLGVAILLEDKTDVDGLNEDWAIPEVVAAKAAKLGEEEEMQIHIEDESGKIPINELAKGNEAIRDLLVELLSLPEFGLDRQKAGKIVDFIKDWIDADSVMTGGGGSESGYFTSLGQPVAPKNKPLDCIDEILMISGIDRNLFYGTKEVPGIGRCLTVHGNKDGKININTAPSPVLKALFKGTPTDDALAQMDAYRKTEGNILSSWDWYKNIPGMAAAIPVNTELITTKSNCFEITAVGRFNNMTGQVSGVIRRSADRKIQLLSWKGE